MTVAGDTGSAHLHTSRAILQGGQGPGPQNPEELNSSFSSAHPPPRDQVAKGRLPGHSAALDLSFLTCKVRRSQLIIYEVPSSPKLVPALIDRQGAVTRGKAFWQGPAVSKAQHVQVHSCLGMQVLRGGVLASGTGPCPQTACEPEGWDPNS